MNLKHVHHRTFDKLICAISIICLAVVLVVVLVLKDSFRTYFKSLSLSWSLGVRSLSLSLSLGGQVQEVLVLVLVLGGQVLVNIPDMIKTRSLNPCNVLGQMSGPEFTFSVTSSSLWRYINDARFAFSY